MAAQGATTGQHTDDELERAWGLIRDQADKIADTITLALFERDFEIYERIGPELRADVRAANRQHVCRALEVLSGDTGKRHSAAELWRDAGRRRARQGVPLELVLNAYTMGSRVLWEALVAQARVVRKPAISDGVLRRAAERVWADLDVVTAVVIDSYRRESARMQRQDLQRQQSVLDALIEGRGADEEFAEEARQVLALETGEAVGCVVALLDGPNLPLLLQAEDRLDKAGVHARWHVRSGVYYGLLAGPLPDEPGLAALFADDPPARMAVALSPDGLAGFATAYQLASRAAETLARDERRVVSVTERLPEVLIAGSPLVAQLLVTTVLGPLLAMPEAQGRTLVDTLVALLRHDGSPTHAAEELYCHRNTVIYRLRQIEELTGRVLADPRDKMLLGLAVMARGPG
ncbi:CdaR family transcriptional regulator [Nocardioides sp. SYSU D00038]|uniref:PucR family transcriptional regulator n=1 Tax=Nocardioides sp. SYSU D00038 TaxID=2812554 RepID=UPI00196725A6|nr:PucR family transcriptional regulator [Nocardioides sp. SYSU D00038]